MPKTLISFIGTGRPDDQRSYRTAQYSFNGNVIASSFVSSVIADSLKVDKLYLLGTTKSMWEEVYRFFCEKNKIELDEDYWIALGEFSDKANHQTQPEDFDYTQLEQVLGNGSRVKIMPYGLNQAEQWSIFEGLEDLLSDTTLDEEIYLDITHSFRSMPLFSMTSIMYIQDVLGKHIQFKGIFYGMLEVMREFDDIAPIVDLSLVIEIQNWIKAAHSFMNYGKGYMLSKLMENEKDAQLIKSFTNAISLNYLKEIEQKLTNLRALSDKSNQGIVKYIIPAVLADLITRLNRAKGLSHAHFQFELSVWHREKTNFAAAYLVFVEAMVTFLCESKGLDWRDFDIRHNTKQNLNKSHPIYKIFRASNRMRNDIAHDLRREGSSIGAINNLTKWQKEFKNILNKK